MIYFIITFFVKNFFHLQPAKLYKLKHLSKVEVIANDPSGCTFTLVMLNLLCIFERALYYIWIPINVHAFFCLLASNQTSYRVLITSEAKVLLHLSGLCAILMTGKYDGSNALLKILM